MGNPINNDVLLVITLVAMLIATYYVTIKKKFDDLKVKRVAVKKAVKSYSPLFICTTLENSFWKMEFRSRDFLNQMRVIPHNVLLGSERVERVPVARARSVSGPSQLDLLPSLPGCEPNGPAVKQMSKRFPDASVPDIVRYLVARKGDVAQASEMMEKANVWRAANLPLKRSVAEPAVMTRCCFYHGKARDGTPALYFRGGLYDNTKAPFQTFVLLAAHTIDYVLRDSKQVAVTVIVHLGTVPGGPNAAADMNFIKYFVQVLSDNYPERLKRLVMYPFPWYGRAIWSCVKMFVDKRSQDKVLLYASSDKSVPDEILEFIDIDEIPTCCEGTNTDPIVDMMTTLSD